MRVLITGHLGYIGPVAIKLFKETGHHVVGLDTGYFLDCITPSEDVILPDEEINRDIRDVQPSDIEDIDAVVHLAALSNDPMGELNPSLTAAINYSAGIRFARLCKEAGVSRFIFASSCSIYGAAGDSDRPLDETAPFNPVSAYAVSKVRMEVSLSELADGG